MYYILIDKKPVEEPNLIEWSFWFQTADRTVKVTTLDTNERISTVFLGIDHNFFGEGPPLLFETMVFGGPFNGDTYRYHTWDEALAGHNLVAKGDVTF